MEKKKVYLSGPDRLKKDRVALYKEKKKLCEKYGFEMLEYPEEVFRVKDSVENNLKVAQKRLELIKECDIIIADTVDFRSFVEPYSEVGFEMGVGYGLGKKMYCYMPDARLCRERFPGEKKFVEGKGYTDQNGVGFEPGPVNLMLEYSATIVEGTLEDALKVVAEDVKKGEI